MKKEKVIPCREVALLIRLREQYPGWSYQKIANELGVHYATVQGWILRKNNPIQLARGALRAFLSKFEIK